MIFLHDPVIGIVLGNADGSALNDPVGQIRSKNHAEQGRMRQNAHHTVCQIFIIPCLQGLRTKAGTVHTVNLHNLFPDQRLTVHGTVDCKISPFGVPSYDKRTTNPGCHRIQILHTILLGRHRCQIDHIEVFLPSNHVLVCAAKGYINQSVFQNIGDGRKLHLPILLNHIDEAVQLQRPESLACEKSLHQCSIRFFIPHIRENSLIALHLRQVF